VNKNDAYASHFERVDAYIRQINRLFSSANKQYAKLALETSFDGSKTFVFSDFPELKKRVDEITEKLSKELYSNIVKGVQVEWDESNSDNNEYEKYIIENVFKKNFRDIGQNKAWFDENKKALQSFLSRKQKGLNLSQKVWKIGGMYQEDVQVALSDSLADAITNGTSAADLSRTIRKNLIDPDKLFRRVRDKYGELQLSRAAKSYNPGPGRYRSSYKNAMRLARTEINISYRTADQVRWNDLDFIVGFEVKRSANPYPCPLCDALAGKYPKKFVFTGWHPQCRCYVTSIHCTDREFESILNDEPVTSANEIKEVPGNFKDWIIKNQDRIQKADESGTLPYFLKDNNFDRYLK